MGERGEQQRTILEASLGRGGVFTKGKDERGHGEVGFSLPLTALWLGLCATLESRARNGGSRGGSETLVGGEVGQRSYIPSIILY